MKKLLTVAAVLLPFLASAQYEPAPQPGFAPAPAPGYASAGPYSRRGPWYIGFGLGTGDGNTRYAFGNYSFDEWHGGANAPTNGFGNFKLGLTLSPNLLVGFDLSVMGSSLTEGGITTALAIANYDAVATWFPQGEGFFFRGGVGLTSTSFEVADAFGSTFDDRVSGYNAVVGVGYAFWLGRSFNLTINLDASAQRYNANDYDLESSTFAAAWVGFDWY